MNRWDLCAPHLLLTKQIILPRFYSFKALGIELSASTYALAKRVAC